MSLEERILKRAYYMRLNGSTASDDTNYLTAQKKELEQLYREFFRNCKLGRSGEVEEFLKLQDSRINPAAYASNAIKEASYYGHSDIVKILLQD